MLCDYLLTPEVWCRHADHEVLQPASSCAPREYPAPDGKISFSLNDSLYRSGTNHDHDQPPHLRLRNEGLPSSLNWPVYAGPESRYCPAGALPSLASVKTHCDHIPHVTSSPPYMESFALPERDAPCLLLIALRPESEWLQVSMSMLRMSMAVRGCRSMRRTACTARPVI